MKKIVIIGATGLGGKILDSLEMKYEYTVLGFLDSDKEKGTELYGYKILGTELELPDLMKKFDLHGAILAIEVNWMRKALVKKIYGIVPKIKFLTIIHSNTQIGRNVDIGIGSLIMSGAIINANSTIGAFCVLDTNSSLGHDGNLNDFTSIGSGVCIGGNLVLGKFSAILLGAKIIENITVGEHSIIDAGALIVKNIKRYSVASGNPAKVIKERKTGEPY